MMGLKNCCAKTCLSKVCFKFSCEHVRLCSGFCSVSTLLAPVPPVPIILAQGCRPRRRMCWRTGCILGNGSAETEPRIAGNGGMSHILENHFHEQCLIWGSHVTSSKDCGFPDGYHFSWNPWHDVLQAPLALKPAVIGLSALHGLACRSDCPAFTCAIGLHPWKFATSPPLCKPRCPASCLFGTFPANMRHRTNRFSSAVWMHRFLPCLVNLVGTLGSQV